MLVKGGTGWRNRFAPSDTYWINNVTNWTIMCMSPIKSVSLNLKNNSRICDLILWSNNSNIFIVIIFFVTPHFSNRFVFWLTVILTGLPTGWPTAYPSEIKNVYCNSGFCLAMTIGDLIHFLKGDMICGDIWSLDTVSGIDINNLQPFLEATCLFYKQRIA